MLGWIKTDAIVAWIPRGSTLTSVRAPEQRIKKKKKEIFFIGFKVFVTEVFFFRLCRLAVSYLLAMWHHL